MLIIIIIVVVIFIIIIIIIIIILSWLLLLYNLLIFVLNNYCFYGKIKVHQVTLLIILVFLSNLSTLKSKTKKCNQLEHFLEKL